MKKSRLLGAVCACLTVVSFNASAAIVTQGYRLPQASHVVVCMVVSIQPTDGTTVQTISPAHTLNISKY